MSSLVGYKSIPQIITLQVLDTFASFRHKVTTLLVKGTFNALCVQKLREENLQIQYRLKRLKRCRQSPSLSRLILQLCLDNRRGGQTNKSQPHSPGRLRKFRTGLKQNKGKRACLHVDATGSQTMPVKYICQYKSRFNISQLGSRLPINKRFDN